MTARDLKDALGPLAAPLAVDAGWTRSAWDAAVHRGQTLTDEQREAYRGALAVHVEACKKLARKLRT